MFDTIVAAVLIGLVVVFVARYLLMRITASKSVVKTNAHMLPGKLALVTVMCTDTHVGQVLVNGQEWTALATQGQFVAGQHARVVRVQGVRLIIEEQPV